MDMPFQFLNLVFGVLGQAEATIPPGFDPWFLVPVGAGIGVGLAALGVGWGIGKLAAASVESIARQPEASGDIRGAMILTAAFIEGVCLFAIVVAMITVLRLPTPPAP